MYTTFPFTFQPSQSVLQAKEFDFISSNPGLRNEKVFFHWKRRVNSYEREGVTHANSQKTMTDPLSRKWISVPDGSSSG